MVSADAQDCPELVLDTYESDIMMTHSTSVSSEMPAYFCIVVFLEGAHFEEGECMLAWPRAFCDTGVKHVM